MDEARERDRISKYMIFHELSRLQNYKNGVTFLKRKQDRSHSILTN